MTENYKEEEKIIVTDRTKYFVDLAKWITVSVALVVVSLRVDFLIKDRQNGLLEIAAYDKYAKQLIITNNHVEKRYRVAEFFAHVAPS